MVGPALRVDVVMAKMYGPTHGLDELPKLEAFKFNELIEIIFIDLLKSRRVDSCHEVLKTLGNTPEREVDERRKVGPCCR